MTKGGNIKQAWWKIKLPYLPCFRYIYHGLTYLWGKVIYIILRIAFCYTAILLERKCIQCVKHILSTSPLGDLDLGAHSCFWGTSAFDFMILQQTLFFISSKWDNLWGKMNVESKYIYSKVCPGCVMRALVKNSTTLSNIVRVWLPYVCRTTCYSWGRSRSRFMEKVNWST